MRAMNSIFGFCRIWATAVGILAIGALVAASCGGEGDDGGGNGPLATLANQDPLVVTADGTGDAGEMVNSDVGSLADADVEVPIDAETSPEQTGSTVEQTNGTAEQASDEGLTEEEAYLEFAQCMRDNGIEEFSDPSVGADGSLQLGRGFVEADIDPRSDEFQEAIEACSSNLEGVALGRGGDLDLVELQDDMLELTQCLRDQGLEVSDPQLENFGADRDRGGVIEFGSDFDPSDPDTQETLDACREATGGFGAFGGGTGGGGTGGRPAQEGS